MPAARWWRRRRRSVELRYRSGGEFDPGDPFGLCLLSVRSDGTAELVNRRRGHEVRYAAAVAPGVLDRVLACLRDGGFPGVPDHVVPAGPTRQVWLGEATERTAGERTPGERTPVMGYHEATGWPGYGEAFRILDSLVVAVSKGELTVVPDPLPGLVVPG